MSKSSRRRPPARNPATQCQRERSHELLPAQAPALRGRRCEPRAPARSTRDRGREPSCELREACARSHALGETWRAGAATAGLLRRGGAETAGWVGSGGRGGDRRRHRASAIAGLLRRQGQDEHGTGLLPFRILYFIIYTGPYILVFMDGIYELKNKKSNSRFTNLEITTACARVTEPRPYTGAHAAGG